ncbi:MAG: hypothetical protein PHD02_00430 [Bacilli bacterium]|nr:hypothetical protein [Bacilli bacterium]
MKNLVEALESIKQTIARDKETLKELQTKEKEIKYSLNIDNNKVIDYEFTNKSIKKLQDKLDNKIETIKNIKNKVINEYLKYLLGFNILLLIMLLFNDLQTIIFNLLQIEIATVIFTTISLFSSNLFYVLKVTDNIKDIDFAENEFQRKSIIKYYKKSKTEKENSLKKIEKEMKKIQTRINKKNMEFQRLILANEKAINRNNKLIFNSIEILSI